MDKTQQRIIDAVDAAREDLTGFFQKLVQCPSLTGQEEEIGRVLVEGLKARGLTDVEVAELKPGHPNVLAYIRGAEDGPTYTFNGHMDLLPPQDSPDWPEGTPYSGLIKDGKIYGRGTVDMKAGTFASFFAGIIFNQLNIPIRGQVMFTGVCDEEICGDLGMLHLLKAGYIKKTHPDDFGLNCEPTDNKEMNVATKGVLRMEVTVTGKGAFNARPYLGISAIDKSVKFIAAVQELHQKISTEKKHALLEPPSVQVSLIKGGEAANLVPEKCVMMVTRRMHPGEDAKACVREIQDIIDRLSAEDTEFKADLSVWGNVRPPAEVDAEAPVVDLIRRAHKAVLGTDMALIGSEGGTDASHVVAQTGIPMPVYGPGDYKLLGTTDEYVYLDDFFNAVKIYALSIYDAMALSKE